MPEFLFFNLQNLFVAPRLTWRTYSYFVFSLLIFVVKKCLKFMFYYQDFGEICVLIEEVSASLLARGTCCYWTVTTCQTSLQALCSLNVTILSLDHSMGRPLWHHLSVGLTSRSVLAILYITLQGGESVVFTHAWAHLVPGITHYPHDQLCYQIQHSL